MRSSALERGKRREQEDDRVHDAGGDAGRERAPVDPDTLGGRSFMPPPTSRASATPGSDKKSDKWVRDGMCALRGTAPRPRSSPLARFAAPRLILPPSGACGGRVAELPRAARARVVLVRQRDGGRPRCGADGKGGQAASPLATAGGWSKSQCARGPRRRGSASVRFAISARPPYGWRCARPSARTIRLVDRGTPRRPP